MTGVTVRILRDDITDLLPGPPTRRTARPSPAWAAARPRSGAPKGKDLQVPGRDEANEFIEIGITWLEAVAFGHVTEIEEKVLIIGVGNTAMDCCRTAKRLCSDRGLRSGAVYDALHLAAAERCKADVFLTFNVPDFARLTLDSGPRVLAPPDPPGTEIGPS